MNAKDYEKNTMIFSIAILLVIIEIIGLWYLSQIKITIYKQLSFIVLDKSEVLVMSDEETRKRIYKNTYIYYKNKKFKYKIEEENLKTLNNEKYKEIKLNVKIKDMKENDIISVFIIDKKINMIDVWKEMWGD